jgi:nitrate/nitrite transporter NarK
MPILERGFWASIPPMVGIVGMFAGGPLTDFLASRCGLRWGRRLPMMVTRFTAAAGYALVLWFSTFAPNSPLRSAAVVVAALSLVAFSTDAGTGAVWAFKQDVGGRYVGSILGWGNMWGNLGAFFSPMIYDHFLGENPQGEDWNAMFLVCMLAFVMAGLCAFGIDATQPIAPPDEPDDKMPDGP